MLLPTILTQESSTMANEVNTTGPSGESDFARQAKQTRPGPVTEILVYLRNNKKWWLTPIILVLLLVALLVILGSTAAAPFMYTLF
jgi:hypothetical protein